jgi:hypothetical protein
MLERDSVMIWTALFGLRGDQRHDIVNTVMELVDWLGSY